MLSIAVHYGQRTHMIGQTMSVLRQVTFGKPATKPCPYWPPNVAKYR